MRRYKDFKKEINRRYLTRLLIVTNCVISHASRLSGLNRTNLYNKFKIYGVDRQKIAACLLERDKENMTQKVRKQLERAANERLVIGNGDFGLAFKHFISTKPKTKSNHVRT